jgi:hypothetical protein
MSLIAHLREAGRMPIRIIQDTLKALWGLTISTGQIVELCHDFAKVGKPIYDLLREDILRSDYCHSDETGWPEDGVAGELWSLSTPDTRYFHRDTREGRVIEELMQGYQGTVACDFYAGYNHVGGSRQRCWVHYLRPLHELKEASSENPAVVAWVGGIVALYHEAVKYQEACREAIAGKRRMDGYGVFDRKRRRRQFENTLLEIARRQVPGAPDRQRVLAQRIENFLPEMFVFVEHPNVPSDNNAAERAIRPAVISRKVCGGTRSAKGSKTRMIMMSLLHTWRTRGLSTIEQGLSMLAANKGLSKARAPAA